MTTLHQYCIYRLISDEGSYIGQTKQIDKRMRQHYKNPVFSDEINIDEVIIEVLGVYLLENRDQATAVEYLWTTRLEPELGGTTEGELEYIGGHNKAMELATYAEENQKLDVEYDDEPLINYKPKELTIEQRRAMITRKRRSGR